MGRNSWECVGAGWQPIVKPVIQLIEAEGGRIQQVKEKFGGLRIYWEEGEGMPAETRTRLENLVRSAVWLCEISCEECGSLGLLGGEHWLSTLCDEHRKE
jgi:hypothetical protein